LVVLFFITIQANSEHMQLLLLIFSKSLST